MPKKTATKDDDENNDAGGVAATPDASAPDAKNLDDFTMDLDKVTEGKSPDGEAVIATPPGANANATDADGTTTAVKSDGNGKEASSGGTEDGEVDGATSVESENATSDDSDDGSNKDGSDGIEKDGEEAPSSSKADGEEDADDSESAKEAGSTENEEENGSSEGEEDEGEQPDELWDLKMVLSVDQILQSANMCETPGCNLVSCCIWSSNLDPETPWYCCLDCQEKDFGGWPEKKEELPLKMWKGGLKEAMLDKCTALVDPPMPDLPSDKPADSVEEAKTEEDKSSGDTGNVSGSGKDNDPSNSDGEDGGEMWELKEVFSANELKKSKPIMCSYGEDGECSLIACSKWVCISGHDPSPWFCCVDHQENDYGGWPEDTKELPIQFLTEENREVIAERCSAIDNPTMPNIPTSQLLVTAGAADEGDNVSAITPPPSHNQAVAESQSEVVVGMARAKGAKKKGGVTPSPMPPMGAAKKPVVKKQSAAAQQKNLEMRNKWQADAERMGGPSARIVCSKPEAKKVIFDMLHDSFCPMNTNGAFQKLKGVVPPPVLRTCLDDMVDKFTGNPFADDSDDEGGNSSAKRAKKSGSSDEYAGSLRLKEGRNLNNNLYYVDHTKLANNGDGLLPEARNELLSDMQGSKAAYDQLSLTIKKITAEASQLESEPTNEELILEVVDLEKKMTDINDKLEEARVHASNEKRAKAVKKGIESMGSIWRKRKRQCIEFISLMEEATEGTISLKKCLKGDGQIDIDSDEAAIKGAKAFASRKRPRVSLAGKGGLKGGMKRSESSDGMRPDENFIGVKLTAQGKPERVFVDEEAT